MNHVNHAEFTYGGGIVTVDGIAHLREARLFADVKDLAEISRIGVTASSSGFGHETIRASARRTHVASERTMF